jgi:two-component system sensor histidine kinase ArlS
MKLSRKVTFNTASGFSIYFALVNIIIYLSFAEYREEEFIFRLEEKAKTAGNLLLEVNKTNTDLLKIFENSGSSRLVNEMLLILNSKFEPVYSSSGAISGLWDKKDLLKIKKVGRLEKINGKFDVFGLLYKAQQKEFYIIVAAEDRWGNNKLRFIASAMFLSLISSLFVIWIANRFFIQQQLKPLENFQEQISRFSLGPTVTLLSQNSDIDEIKELTIAYNNLLTKVTQAFEIQREFNSNASHELKTPITRIAFQTEVLMNDLELPEKSRETIKKIHNEILQLSDLVNSLLLMSKLDKVDETQSEFTERIDEMIFEAYDSVHHDYPEFKMSFSINSLNNNFDNNMELKCLRPLIVSCFRNLLKNACIYSENQSAKLEITLQNAHNLNISIRNNGKVLTSEEREKLFEPFARGTNAQGIQGYGLGLRMTKRILEKYNAQIDYSVVEGENCFSIDFHN